MCLNDLNQVMVSCGFSENKGLGGVSVQSCGLIKPGVGGSSYTDNYCRSKENVTPAKYTFFSSDLQTSQSTERISCPPCIFSLNP